MAENLIRELPKTELHVHIEGTMEPELVFKLAEKNGIQLNYTLEEAKAKRENFADLVDFLRLYYDACSVLQYESDFYELAMEYLRRAASDRVVYAEIFFDPQTHTQRGIPFNDVINGLHRASQEAELTLGIKSRFIMCFLRDRPVEEAYRIIQEAIPHKDKIFGIGLDSDEANYPARLFKDVYETAIKVGLAGPNGEHVVAHAGEESDATSVIEALVILKARRIDHGVRALEDPCLIQFLKENSIPLTTCPNSCICLKVTSRFFNNTLPMKSLLDQGVLISINSDDPAFFKGYILDNYLTFLNSLPSTDSESRKQLIITLCKNSFISSFMPAEDKSSWCSEIDRIASSNS